MTTSPEEDLTSLHYNVCMKLIDELMARDPKKESRAGRLLLALADIVAEYETEHFPFGEHD